MTTTGPADWRPWGPRPVIAPGTRSSLARGSALSVAGLVAQGALRFLTAWLVGRIAGREWVGQVATAISIATFLSLLWPTSAGAAMSRFVARALGAGDVDGARSLARFVTATAVVAAGVGAAVAVPAWRVIGDGTLSEGLIVALLVVALGGYGLVRGSLFALGRVERAAASDVLTSVVGLGGLAALLAAGARGVTLTVPLVVANLLYVGLNWPAGTRHAAAEGPPRREVTTFIALTTVGTLASTGFLQLSQVVVRTTGDAREAGGYAAALTLATPTSLLVTALSLVLFPTLADALGRGDRPAFLAQTDAAMRGIATVMVGALGTLAVLARVLVAVVWGRDYAEVADLLPVLSLAILVTTLGVASVSALNIESQRGVVTTTLASVSGMLVGILVWVVAAPECGTVAVAAGYLAGVTVLAGIPVVVVMRRHGQRWSRLLLTVGCAVLVAGAAVLVERRSGWGPWLDVALASAFAAGWFAVQRRDVRRVAGAFRGTA